MLLACNLGNTDLLVGVFDGDTLRFSTRLATSRERSADETAILLGSVFALHGMSAASVDGAVVASVVRPLNGPLLTAVETLTGAKPLLVGPGVKTGLDIRTDVASQLGADIVANAVAALSLAPAPLVFVDFGTATTLTGINAGGELCGVLICPGIRISLDALSDAAAELPRIAMDAPKALFGKNTIDSMASGTVYGHAAMVDGLLDRIAAEWGLPGATVLATGAWAEKVVPHCSGRHGIRIRPDLTLLGLKRIAEMNVRARKG